MRVIRVSQIPKSLPEKHLSAAAKVPGKIDDIAKMLNTKPYKYKDGVGLNGLLYEKFIYFQLDTGAYAAVNETDPVSKYEYLLQSSVINPTTGKPYLEEQKHLYEPGKLDIFLFAEDFRFYYDEDLNEVVEFLGFDQKLVKKIPGLVPSANYWRPARAKKM